MPTLRELGEVEVIRRLRAGRVARTGGTSSPPPSPGTADFVTLGSGDDAALLSPAPGRDLAVTVDAFVEGRHYRPEWISDAALGARLAEANLSDLAAMAAAPRAALLSLGVRAERTVESLVALQEGVLGALAVHGASIVGGNLTAVDGAEWMSLTLFGDCAHGAAWMRSGARAGDWIAVTGWPGRAHAAVRIAQALGAGVLDREHAELAAAWRAPRARIDLALALAAHGGVRAAIDISDGLSGDLTQLCAASGVGARLESAAWPADPALAGAARALGMEPDALREGPSDDYELLLALAPEARLEAERIAAACGVPLAVIGRFTPHAGVLEWIAPDGARRALGAGFDHFSQ